MQLKVPPQEGQAWREAGPEDITPAELRGSGRVTLKRDPEGLAQRVPGLIHREDEGN